MVGDNVVNMVATNTATTKGLVIAGLSGGSGKSVVAVGLAAAFARRGLRVVPFKKGPDYIDAGWLHRAAGEKCYNLDPYLMSEKTLLASYAKRARRADIVLVEGNRGLYDGVKVTGGYSTAELANSLGLPVLLVVNCTKTTRTIAAMVMGCQHFDPGLRFAGVILNQIATKRQKKLITTAVEQYTKLPVLGAIPRMPLDIFPMRHLGMVPYQEYADSQAAVDTLADTVERHLDLDRIHGAMGQVTADTEPNESAKNNWQTPAPRIGVIQDAAFQFYYSENLEALENEGAELVYLNAMEDDRLPPLDGLYIGGGFPETSAKRLAANSGFRRSVKEAADSGMVIYAECGGLIYLGESISVDGEDFSLAGVFPVRFAMEEKPQAHGYSHFVVEGQNNCYPQGIEVRGHEFRYSKIVEWRGSDRDLSVKMTRGTGFVNGRDGLVYNNVFALYTHVHAEATPEWAKGFVNSCREKV